MFHVKRSCAGFTYPQGGPGGTTRARGPGSRGEGRLLHMKRTARPALLSGLHQPRFLR